MAEVIWSDNALGDIEEIGAFIERDSIYYAELLVQRVFENGNNLRDFPRRGRKVPERNDANIREIQVNPYRIIYRVDPETVTVITVLHSRRNVRKILKNLLK